jgi:hypothetical protein
MSDGLSHTPLQPHPLAPDDAALARSAGQGQRQPADVFADSAPPLQVLAPSPAYQNLAQQMQAFLSRTDSQHGRKNKFFLQQTLELLAELDQHTARETHLQTALQDTQAHIFRLKQKLVDMAADSVDAEREALSIAQARAHLATLLHDKLTQEFK